MNDLNDPQRKRLRRTTAVLYAWTFTIATVAAILNASYREATFFGAAVIICLIIRERMD